MRKLAIGVALATTAMTAPALARDGSPYVGIEGGLMIVEDLDLDYEDALVDEDQGVEVEHNRGIDLDIIGGYDFGAFRVEAELGHKRASLDTLTVTPAVIDEDLGGTADASGRARVLSGMVNLLADFEDDSGWSGFVGGGLGLARVKYSAAVDDTFDVDFADSDQAWAWQALAGVRYGVSPNMDLGLKYRFFNTGRLNFGDGTGVDAFRLSGRWRSHSLLASLIYNFAPPPPPPPPPAPPPPPPEAAPATQTCPDGSVILATDACPVPPPPPPPPPPEPERG